MPELTDADKVLRNDTGKRIAAAIESLAAPEAEKVSYDNTESGMTADNIQDAIDELKSDIDSVELVDLDDVNLTSPQDEDELHYDSATSKWKNIAKKIYEKSASGSLVSFNDGGDNIPLKSLIVNITAVQSGSGTPAPDNERAISGWSGAKVSSTGKNLFDYTNYQSIDVTGGGVYRNGHIFPSGTYTVRNNSASSDFYYKTVKADHSSYGTAVQVTSNSSANVTVAEGYLLYAYSSITPTDVMVAYGESQIYEPFGTTHTIPFGQTVYGCLLDVINGVLTITHGIVDLGSLTWSKDTTTRPVDSATIHAFYATLNECKMNYSGTSKMVCSIFTPSTVQKVDYGGRDEILDNICAGADGNHRIWAYGSIYNNMSTTEFKTAMNGVQLVYELATPVTYQLTPTQVKTLLGLNNIFADTGDISLSYFTQNANAINDIAESNTRTALNTDVPKTDLTDIFVTGTKNNTGATISAGKYFYVNNQLAYCKSDIGATADLTLGTNYELVTAGVLNKLNETVTTQTVEGITWTIIKQGRMYDLFATIPVQTTSPIMWGDFYIYRNASLSYSLPVALTKKISDLSFGTGNSAFWTVYYTDISTHFNNLTTADVIRPTAAGGSSVDVYKHIRGYV